MTNLPHSIKSLQDVKELVTQICEENNLSGPCQISLGYDFKDSLKNLKKIANLKLRIQELTFLDKLKHKEVDIENGQPNFQEVNSYIKKKESNLQKEESDFQNEISDIENLDESLVFNEQITVSKKRAIYERILEIKIAKVKKDLDIDVSDKLDLADLNKLEITKAFVSFETEEIKNKFEQISRRKVTTT